MKKLILILITILAASCFATTIGIKNKGSSNLSSSNILPGPIQIEHTDLTAETTHLFVQRIPTMAIVNCYNTQKPNYCMVQWRRQFNMTITSYSTIAAAIVFPRGTTVLKIWPIESFNMISNKINFAWTNCNGANECTASIVDYNSFGYTSRTPTVFNG